MATELVPEIADIAEKLRNGRPVEPVTVRTFLWWFGAQRRGFNIVRHIRQELEEAGIETFPDFEDRWVDAPISFQLTPRTGGGAPPDVADDLVDGDDGQSVEGQILWVNRDPTHRISKLSAANQPVESVAPTASLEEVVTKLLARDFSQLPVMSNERTVKGVISWKTIGSRLALGCCSRVASAFMEEHHEVRANQSIFEAIPIIRAYDYVLVRGEDNAISGIVTASDLSFQFQNLSEPFLLLSEIENSVRNMIGGKFSRGELLSVRDPGDGRAINDVHDLTFGEYIRLLQNAENWAKLNLPIDRVLFCKDLDAVRLIRNDVTHFDPDGVTPEDLERLRDFKAFLQAIGKIVGVGE